MYNRNLKRISRKTTMAIGVIVMCMLLFSVPILTGVGFANGWRIAWLLLLFDCGEFATMCMNIYYLISHEADNKEYDKKLENKE